MALKRRRAIARAYKRYQTYKRYLRVDFAYACAYCDLHENEFGGLWHFHVEHHRPWRRPEFAHLVTTYGNLLYACGVCNTYKGDDWPADDPVAAGAGYLDPCEHDFDAHFAPARGFRVAGRTGVGRYMVEALHLNRRQLRVVRARRARRLAHHQAALARLDQLEAGFRAVLAQARPPEDHADAHRGLALAADERGRLAARWARQFVPEFEAADFR